ncbi:integrase, catalytic region, zinc finger, CCHC-type containing protein, partial [Tanacetum coccineum]
HKKYFEIEKKELSLDNDWILEHTIYQDVINIVMHANVHPDNVLHANNNSLEHDNYALELLKHKNDRLMELLIYQDLKLREHIANIKGKNVVESVQNVHTSNVITLKVYKLDFPPLSPCIKNNMAANVDYLKHTQENADILREIVKHAKLLRPLDSDIASAFCNENVMHSMLNAKSKLVCATFHECMFDAIHDLYVSDYLNDVNARVKSKFVKSRPAKSKKKEMWKPTGTIRFKNDQIAKIIGYSDYQLGDTNLFSISLDDMLKSSPICLLSKASKTKSWLWHRRLSHLNFVTLNQFPKQGLVQGLQKMKFEKDRLSSGYHR